MIVKLQGDLKEREIIKFCVEEELNCLLVYLKSE